MKTALLISGPSCSGKSTVEAELCRRAPGTYVVAYDKLKWQLAGYNRDSDRETVKALLLGFFEVVCAQGLPIILQVFMRDDREYAAYARIAETHGYRLRAIQLTAPTDVLIDRFRDRVARATAAGSNISVRDEALYRKNLEWQAYVPDGTPTFDTASASVESIADAILSQPSAAS